MGLSVQTPVFTRDARVGDWWTPCCLLDLREIRDDDDLHAMRKWVAEGAPCVGVWATHGEALASLDAKHSTLGPILCQQCRQLVRWVRTDGALRLVNAGSGSSHVCLR